MIVAYDPTHALRYVTLRWMWGIAGLVLLCVSVEAQGNQGDLTKWPTDNPNGLWPGAILEPVDLNQVQQVAVASAVTQICALADCVLLSLDSNSTWAEIDCAERFMLCWYRFDDDLSVLKSGKCTTPGGQGGETVGALTAPNTREGTTVNWKSANADNLIVLDSQYLRPDGSIMGHSNPLATTDLAGTLFHEYQHSNQDMVSGPNSTDADLKEAKAGHAKIYRDEAKFLRAVGANAACMGIPNPDVHKKFCDIMAAEREVKAAKKQAEADAL